MSLHLANFLNLLPVSMSFLFPSICLSLLYLHSKLSYHLESMIVRFPHSKYLILKQILTEFFTFSSWIVYLITSLHVPNLCQTLFQLLCSTLFTSKPPFHRITKSLCDLILICLFHRGHMKVM